MNRPKLNLHLKKGALHHALHIPQGQKIPESTLRSAMHSHNALTRKRARLAEAMRHWKHGIKHT